MIICPICNSEHYETCDYVECVEDCAKELLEQVAQLQARLESEEAHYTRLAEQHKAELDAISDIPNIEDWLLSREQDIAFGIEDFGDLKPLFVCLFRRQPERNPNYG